MKNCRNENHERTEMLAKQQTAADEVARNNGEGVSVSVNEPAYNENCYQEYAHALEKDASTAYYGAVDVDINDDNVDENEHLRQPPLTSKHRSLAWINDAARQMPAVALVAMFHLMVGIPFGVSYFPVGWSEPVDTGMDMSSSSSSSLSPNNVDDVSGAFPLPGKEALGIRMFLFSTIVGQIAFTFFSKFANPIGLQMVENVPFCHALAYIVIKEQGYGMGALSTLMFLFGLSSVMVGVVFFLLGHFQLGRVVYFFPSHVLVGCIGGIGIFIVITGVEVTMDAVFALTEEGITQVGSKFLLLLVVACFELLLRLLTYVTEDHTGKARYPLLTPIYFCSITPIFYLALLLFGVSISDAENAGAFFPRLDDCASSINETVAVTCEENLSSTPWMAIFNDDLWQIFKIVDFSTISWKAVFKSIPTMVALTAFSLIHVPINIPAFAISTNVEADMNAELVAHGYSNFFVGLLGGLQNYMAYTQSILYAKSGGGGTASSLAVAFITTIFFFVGPTIASYIPRCMAGTLLVHVGIDLFLEGVYDSYGKFDRIEYAGIWVITSVMTTWGMSAALIAGVISALSTYAVQSIAYLNPIRGFMSASTLTSSSWNRQPEAKAILEDDDIGRNKIFVIQLQGHLFFGNVAELADTIKGILSEKQGTKEEPLIVIIDFTLVLGLDSSAAQTISKLNSTMRKKFKVQLAVFVSGSCDGFPTAYPLSRELSEVGKMSEREIMLNDNVDDNHNEGSLLLQAPGRRIMVQRSRGDSFSLTPGAVSLQDFKVATPHPQNHVCDNLDSALVYSENLLISRVDPDLLEDNIGCDSTGSIGCPLNEEIDIGLKYLAKLCPGNDFEDVKHLFYLFKREEFKENDVLWRQGSTSNCAKLVVFGAFISNLEKEADTSEPVRPGDLVGEFGLVNGTNRMSTVRCTSHEAVVYSLNREPWEQLATNNPKIARFVDMIVVRYLAQRVCHVSNRIFETRCLPV